MVEKKDVDAALHARQELGKAYEPEIVEAFLERIERRLEERHPAPVPRSHHHETRLALGSMALGIAVTAVATSDAHGAGGIVIAIIAWLAIAAINVSYLWRR